MNKEKCSLIIRADASSKTGTGHLMRCLALGQAWRESDSKVIFISSCDNLDLRKRLLGEGFECVVIDQAYPDPVDLETTLGVLSKDPKAWLVCDGYHFDTGYYDLIKQSGHKLLVIDDLAHLNRYHADIILNQNLYADALKYSVEGSARFLPGPKYSLLRREFLPWQKREREVPSKARRVLITLGGSDPSNVTAKVMEAISLIMVKGLEALVVIGGGNPYYQELQHLNQRLARPVQILRDVANMPELMAWADVAVAAGGSTAWELAFMGLPSVILVLAENQQLNAEYLEKEKVMVNLGWHGNASPVKVARVVTDLIYDEEKRREMARRGRQMVDGQGADRVLMRIRDDRLRLRKVVDEDCLMLWEWANAPEVRRASFSTEDISLEEHLAWFNAKRQDPNCFFYLALDEDDYPVGQVRMEINPVSEAEISVSVNGQKRGAGYGSELIKMAVEELFRLSSVEKVHAFIKPFNLASIKSFSQAGFNRVGERMVKGSQVEYYVKVR